VRRYNYRELAFRYVFLTYISVQYEMLMIIKFVFFSSLFSGDSLRKSSSDLSCKSFTEIVGSGTATKKPSMSTGRGGVKQILDRRLKAADGHNNNNKTNKSSFRSLKESSVYIILCIFTVSYRFIPSVFIVMRCVLYKMQIETISSSFHRTERKIHDLLIIIYV